MAKGKKRSEKVDVGKQGPMTGNPFAALLGEPTESEQPASATEPVDSTRSPDWDGVGRVVLRMQRKGRGGKTVTLVEGLDSVGSDRIAAVAKELRKGLGVGSSVEGANIVVHGDQRDRLAEWFAARDIPTIKS